MYFKSGTTRSSETLYTSFESPNQRLIGYRWAKVWQHFNLLPRPFEKSHFTPYKGQGYDIHFRKLYYCLYILFWNLTTVTPPRIFVFVFYKMKSEASFIGLSLKKGYYYSFSVWNYMNFKSLQSTIALFWNDLRGKYPCVQNRCPFL